MFLGSAYGVRADGAQVKAWLPGGRQEHPSRNQDSRQKVDGFLKGVQSSIYRFNSYFGCGNRLVTAPLPGNHPGFTIHTPAFLIASFTIKLASPSRML